MGVLREVVHLPETDPTHRGALESAPPIGPGRHFFDGARLLDDVDGQTQALEPEAKRVMNEKLRQMREDGETDAAVTGHEVLDALGTTTCWSG